MKELLAWLSAQNESARTYMGFAERARDLIPQYPQHAAALRLLSDLAASFFTKYADEPLSADVGGPALTRIRELLEMTERSSSESAEFQLGVLNRIATTKLD